ncbi:MAG: co-chaperone GroES [Gallicola sp.]|nr:co-chaperone GroES [Gallicola sp.]
MGLKPIGERIVIKMIEEEEAKTSSGIVLPNSAKEKPEVAEVVAISDEILNDDDTSDLIKVGDKVVYSKYAGTEVTVDKEEYIVVKLDDVLAIVE